MTIGQHGVLSSLNLLDEEDPVSLLQVARGKRDPDGWTKLVDESTEDTLRTVACP